jgi:hypothetical protein
MADLRVRPRHLGQGLALMPGLPARLAAGLQRRLGGILIEYEHAA